MRSLLILRRFRTSGNKCENKSIRSEDGKKDLIGPPDPLSNLRPIIFYKPNNESEIEQKYRLKRIEVQAWNQEFWSKHNSNFIKEKEEYTKQLKHKLNDQHPNADQMSVFYKSFLDKNWENHLYYNINWYKKNLELLILSFKVKIVKLKQNIIKTF